MNEAPLEPLLRRMRLRHVLPVVAQYRDCELLDIGCGWEARLLRSVESSIARGEGIDQKAPELRTEKLTTRRVQLSDSLPYRDESFDVVTMLAVLEHLAYPGAIVAEICRVLRPGGRLLLTVPSKAAKPVLELLAYRLGLVSELEIGDHKCYYTKHSLRELIFPTGLEIEAHHYFQLGMNNMLICRKNSLQRGTEGPAWRAGQPKVRLTREVRPPGVVSPGEAAPK